MDRMPGLLRRRVGLNSSSDFRPQMDSPLRAVTCVDSDKLCGNRMTQAATAAVGQQCEKGGVISDWCDDRFKGWGGPEFVL